MRRRRRSTLGFTLGFTLLEVMVSLALLAAALMAVADLAGSALRNHAYARDLSAATLLARGKMAELEQKYQDEGFKDFDQDEHGDFAEEGRADITWQLALVKPDADLSADQLMALLTGMSGGDSNDLIAKLMGGAGLTGAAAGGGAPGPTSTSPLAGLMGGFLQTQLTAFGETLKRSLREMRLTVSWRDGQTPRGFTVTTHLLVLNPRAPGGARGDNPEVPANLVTLPAAGTQQQQGTQKPGAKP
jgi:general secretion pathway protein I